MSLLEGNNTSVHSWKTHLSLFFSPKCFSCSKGRGGYSCSERRISWIKGKNLLVHKRSPSITFRTCILHLQPDSFYRNTLVISHNSNIRPSKDSFPTVTFYLNVALAYDSLLIHRWILNECIWLWVVVNCTGSIWKCTNVKLKQCNCQTCVGLTRQTPVAC